MLSVSRREPAMRYFSFFLVRRFASSAAFDGLPSWGDASAWACSDFVVNGTNCSSDPTATIKTAKVADPAMAIIPGPEDLTLALFAAQCPSIGFMEA